MFESRSPKSNRSVSQSARAAERAMFAPRPFKFIHDTDQDSGASDTAPVQARLNPPMTVNFLTLPMRPPERSLPIQPKLTIGQSGDQYEQEADRMASQVMRMPNSPDGSQPIFQLMRSRSPVQAKGNDTEATQEIESQLSQSKGGGSPLLDEVRSFMEPRFSADFSQVKVHTDNRSVQMNQTLGAQAFTHGSDIYFGSGKSPAKNDLTAHELTHVVQQTGAVQTKISANQPDIQRKCSACESEDSTVNRKEDSAAPNIQHKIGDGHDLQSPRFAGDPILESVFDDEHHIRQPETGDHVAKIQQALLDLDPSCLPEHGVDGIYGSETSSAAQKLQIQNNLTPALGNIGPKTMTELDQRFRAELPKPVDQNQPSETETPPATDQNQPPQLEDLPPCPESNVTLDPTEKTNAKSLSGGSNLLCQIKPPTKPIFDKLGDIPPNKRRQLSIYESPVPSEDIEAQFSANFIPSKSVTLIQSSSVPADPKLQKGLERVAFFLQHKVKPSLNLNQTMSVEIKAASGLFRFTKIALAPIESGTEILLIEKIGSLPAAPTQGQLSTNKTSFETKYKGFGFKLTSVWSSSQEISQLDDALTQVSISARNKTKDLIFDRRSSQVGSEGEAGHYNPGTHTIEVFQSAFDSSALRYGRHNLLAKVLDHEVGHATAHATVNHTPNKKLMAEFKAAARLDGASDDKTGERTFKGADNVVKVKTVKGGITEYGDVDIGEYYAEAFSLYSLDPTTTELIRPNVFKFFKKNFP